MKPFLSLCIIVRNEEKVLGRCLDSVFGIIDEIVVVDTGSTDNTKEIARKYVNEVYDFEWTDNFADARNFAASKANGDWILVLDADEFVDRENLKEAINAIKKDEQLVDAYEVKIFNFIGVYGEQIIQHSNFRVYRNDMSIKFYRSIHEQLVKENGDLKTGSLDLVIYHSGYLNKTVKEKKKSERNAPLVKSELQKASIKAFDYFNLGNEYFSQNKMDLALDAYKKAYVNKPAFEYSWVKICVVQIINCLLRLERYNDALDVIRDAEEIWERSAEFKYLKANVYFAQNRLDDAEEELLDLLKNKERYDRSIFSVDFRELYPHKFLGNIYSVLKQYKKAVYHYTMVLNINRIDVDVIANLITLLVKYSKEEEIYSFIEKFNWLDDYKILTHIIRVCLILSGSVLANKLVTHLNEGLLKRGFVIKLHIIDQKFDDALKCVMKESLESLNNMIGQGCFDFYDLLVLGLQQAQESFLNLIETLVEGENKKFVGFLRGKHNVADTQNYLKMLERCIQLRQFDLFERLVSKRNCFEKSIYLSIGHILFRYEFKDIAVDFYSKVDVSCYDKQAFLNIIESFIEKQYLDDALQFAFLGLEKYHLDYRFYKYAIELLVKKGIEEDKDKMVQIALQHYPDSNWLKDMLIFA